MANLRTLCSVTFLFLITSCSPSAIPSPPLDYEIRIISYQSENCEPERDACLMVEFDYPYFAVGDSAARAMANRMIRNSTLEFIGMGDVEATTTPELEAAIINLDRSFQRLKGEVGTSVGWMAEVHTAEIYRDDSVLVLELNLMNYLGGAHGQYATRYFNFDRESGSLKKLIDFVDNETFKAIAEQAFKAKYVANGQNYLDAGFSFLEGKFTLPGNFAFKGDSLILHYNHYEIAPYAAGQFEVSIPLP